MSERRPTAAAPAPDSLAAMSEHLGRLLTHADRLLEEWKDHADGMKARFEAEARVAGETLHRTLEAALAETAAQSNAYLTRHFSGNAERLAENLKKAQEAAERLGRGGRGGGASSGGGSGGDFADVARQLAELRETIASQASVAARRGGGGTTTRGREARLILILALSANVLLVAAIAILLLRAAPAAPSASAGPGPGKTPVAGTTPASAIDAGVAAPPVAVDPTPPETRVATPCATLAFSGPDAERSLAECLEHICESPDGAKPSAPDNCELVDKDKKSKRKALRCTIGGAGANEPARTLSIDLPADCP